MSSQANMIKQTSERNREQIRAQYMLLGKGKSAQKLIDLIQEYELDSKCETLDEELTFYLVVGYIVQNDWLALKHLTKRYHLDDIFEGILQLAVAGVNEQLKQLCITLYPKVLHKLMQKSKNFTVRLDNFDHILEQAKINFALKTYQKYYVTLDVKTIISTVGCKQEQITKLGYEIKDGFVEFKQKQTINSKVTQQALLKKVKNLISVAENMTVLE